jgi:hypothetical protein
MADSLPLPEIIQRYLNGESMQQLATEARVNRLTLYRWMLAYTGTEYDHLITDALITRIADADQSLDDAEDNCSIARAREHMKYSRMDFERRRPKLYGPKHEMEIDNKITVVINRLGPQQVVVGQGQGETVEGEVKEIKTLDVKTS